MAKRKREIKPLPTIWRVSDDLWGRVGPIILELDPPAETGRKRGDDRAAFNGIIFRLRSGVQWSQLPREFGSKTAVHRAMQRWIAPGVFERVWSSLIAECEELGGVDWQWESADAAMGKARFGGITSAPTRRIVRKTARNAA